MRQRDRVVNVWRIGLVCAVVGLFLNTHAAGQEPGEAVSAYFDRSYYTSEAEAAAICRIGLPADVRQNAVIEIADSSGRVIAKKKSPEEVIELQVPLDTLPAGNHIFHIRVHGQAGKALASRDVTLTKRPPKPGREWKIDRRNRVLLNNGKPFFPFGFLLLSKGSEPRLKELADMGCNTVFHWGTPYTPEEAKRFLDAAAQCGLFVVTRLEAFGGERDGFRDLTFLKGHLNNDKEHTLDERSQIFKEAFEKALPNIVAGVEAVRDHPNLMAYTSFDEPIGSRVFRQYEQGLALYRKTNETDGYHPIHLNAVRIKEGERQTGWCDIFGLDPYWIPGMPVETNRSMVRVATMTARVKEAADLVGKPVWVMPMAEYYSLTYKRLVSAKEQLCQTYLAVITGGRGIVYYFYQAIGQRRNWEALARLAREMKVLGPAIVSGDVPCKVAYQSGDGPRAFLDLSTDAFGRGVTVPDVMASIHRHPQEGIVILAANHRHYSVDVTYHVPFLSQGVEVRHLFNGNRYRVENGAFTDRLNSLDTRAYRLGYDGEIVPPMSVTVEMKTHPELGRAEAAPVPRTGRPGKRNIAPNPSFEDTTLPDWPDYYLPGWFPQSCQIGTPECPYRLDTDNPFHGRQCLRLDASTQYRKVRTSIAPKHDRPTEYVISVYARGDRENARITMSAGGKTNRPPALSTQWQRIRQKIVVPANLGRFYHIAFTAFDGVVWLDAVQMEQGAEATAFEP